MKDTTRTRAIAYLALGLAGMALAITGRPVDTTSARTALGVVSFVPAVLGAYDRWLWRIPWLPFGPPILRGTWRVNFTPAAVVTNATAGSGYIVIRQTAVWLSVTMYTPESTSVSTTTSISRGSDGTHSMSWMYCNEPRIEHRDRSPIHYGAARASSFSGRRPSELHAAYFTDRLSAGDLRLSERRSVLANSHDAAQAAVQTTQRS